MPNGFRSDEKNPTTRRACHGGNWPQSSIELQRVTRKGGGQSRLEGIRVGHAGGLQHGGLGGQAGQLCVCELQAGELGFDFIAEGVKVVVLVVDGNVGHG